MSKSAELAELIRARAGTEPPRLGLILGSGLGHLAAEVEGGQFVWADAKIAGDKVVVTAGGKTIRNVRYGYRANATGLANLYNREALPASPFATENKW